MNQRKRVNRKQDQGDIFSWTESDSFNSEPLPIQQASTCQLSRIMRESQACGSKTSVTCIEDNFLRLTHNSGQLVLFTLTTKIQFSCPENIPINGA